MKRIIIIFGILVVITSGILLVLTTKNYFNNETRSEEKEFDKPEGFNQYFRDITVPFGKTSSGYGQNSAYHELLAAKSRVDSKKSSNGNWVWTQRGPANVAGRTRSILVDPDDPFKKTWFAGTAGGGIWKTTNAGFSWTDITPNLPNLSTTTLCMASSDHNVIYAGTGEGFGGEGMIAGNGILISNNRGGSWNILPSTDGNQDFRYVNKIWVDPSNKNIIIVATNTGILKSTDGGTSWKMKYFVGNRVQDIVHNPLNANILYAAVNSRGVIKSYNKGETWVKSNYGIGQGRRFSLAVSPVDTSYVYASAENNNAEMDLYTSVNSGLSWIRQNDISFPFYNYHKSQGWYNNVIKAHPFDKHQVYVGGVHMGLVTVSDVTVNSAPQVLDADTLGTSGFLAFINFGGGYLGGGMSTGLAEDADVKAGDFLSAELRFGPGKHQKAHRFTVPVGRGSGVADTLYVYQDYVDVPFEAWDTKNNKQLTISFRDQERDGAFNLIQRDPNNEVPGREYIFIQAIPYDPVNPSPLVTINGGHYKKMLYFFWPTLSEEGSWLPDNLPVSKLYIDYGTAILKNVTTKNIQDDTKNTNLHVDHHDLAIIPGAGPSDPIRLIDANDGGVAVSLNSGDTWEQLNNGLITTQFYGVAKKPGANEYIGGMQDNGTWQSPPGVNATQSTDYNFKIGGDGFQVLWNTKNTTRILGSTYNNELYLSNNSGSNWTYIGRPLGSNGPFITKLSNSKGKPDQVFLVGSAGVYSHDDFGRRFGTWTVTNIGKGWTVDGTAYSSLNVKVSDCDPSVVWAGAGMFIEPQFNIFLSRDYGVTFNPVNNYKLVDLGLISGMRAHPTNPAEAYMLFSYKGQPKILRTYDYGQDWHDISGFGTDSVSSNGFPDVVVHDLLIMEQDTSILWAGTEIGIFESLDNGLSWHILESNLPSVSIFQLMIQDGQVVAATHGRGIWTTNIWPVGIQEKNLVSTNTLRIFPNPAENFISFEYFSGENSEINVKIISLSGQILLSQKVQLDPGEKNIRQLNISSLKAGTYILELSHGSINNSARFIKQ